MVPPTCTATCRGAITGTDSPPVMPLEEWEKLTDEFWGLAGVKLTERELLSVSATELCICDARGFKGATVMPTETLLATGLSTVTVVFLGCSESKPTDTCSRGC